MPPPPATVDTVEGYRGPDLDARLATERPLRRRARAGATVSLLAALPVPWFVLRAIFTALDPAQAALVWVVVAGACTAVAALSAIAVHRIRTRLATMEGSGGIALGIAVWLIVSSLTGLPALALIAWVTSIVTGGGNIE